MDALRNDGRNAAIVVGGSMTGLIAARALADHFHEVLLLERDELGDSAEHRRGVPQGLHAHALLASGSRVMESLLPGILSELVEGGVSQGDMALNVRWFLEDALLQRCTSNIEGFGVSRPFLERIVRARVRKVSNVRFHENVRVEKLSVTKDNRRVVGVESAEKTFCAN